MEQSHENPNWFSPIKFNGGKATPDPFFFFIALLYRWKGPNITAFATDSAVTWNTPLESGMVCTGEGAYGLSEVSRHGLSSIDCCDPLLPLPVLATLTCKSLFLFLIWNLAVKIHLWVALAFFFFFTRHTPHMQTLWDFSHRLGSLLFFSPLQDMGWVGIFFRIRVKTVSYKLIV